MNFGFSIVLKSNDVSFLPKVLSYFVTLPLAIKGFILCFQSLKNVYNYILVSCKMYYFYVPQPQLFSSGSEDLLVRNSFSNKHGSSASPTLRSLLVLYSNTL